MGHVWLCDVDKSLVWSDSLKSKESADRYLVHLQYHANGEQYLIPYDSPGSEVMK